MFIISRTNWLIWTNWSKNVYFLRENKGQKLERIQLKFVSNLYIAIHLSKRPFPKFQNHHVGGIHLGLNSTSFECIVLNNRFCFIRDIVQINQHTTQWKLKPSICGFQNYDNSSSYYLWFKDSSPRTWAHVSHAWDPILIFFRECWERLQPKPWRTAPYQYKQYWAISTSGNKSDS